MATQIHINAADIGNFLVRFNKIIPSLLKTTTEKDTTEFQELVHASMKRRAPSWSGYLRSTIKKEPARKEGREFIAPIRVGAEHAWFQEVGYRPHWISARTITGSPRGGYTYFRNWMNTHNVKGKGAMVTRYKPYIRPSIISAVPRMGKRYSQDLLDAFVKAFKQSGNRFQAKVRL